MLVTLLGLGLLLAAFVCFKVISWLRPEAKEFDAAAFLAAAVPEPCKRPRTLAVVLNPVAGGQGRAASIWARAKTVLESAAPDVKVLLIRTRVAGHARQWALEELPDDVDTILCIGGDGTLFEIVNGIFARADAAAVFSRVSVAVVPAGSGNGLGSTLGIQRHEIEKAVALAIRGRTRKLNVIKATQGSSVSFGLLFMSYGVIADCDLESEAYRILGPLRFTIAGVIRILFKRRYRVRLQYTPVVKFENRRDVGTPCSGSEPVTQELDLTGLIVSNCPWLSSDFFSAPKAALDDGLLDLTFAAMTRGEMTRMLLESETGSYCDFPSVSYVKCRSVRVEAIGCGLPKFFFDDLRRKGRFDLDGEPFNADVPMDLAIHDVSLQICH